MNAHSEFDARMEKLGQLLEELEQRCAPSALEPARSLLSAVLAVHQSGLSRLIDLLHGLERKHDGLDLPVVSTLREDPVVAALLALHELVPASEQPKSLPPDRPHGFVPVARLHVKTRGAMP
jgi:hypothetical protein